MNRPSVFADRAARRIWLAMVGTEPTADVFAANVDELFTQLRNGLGRWIGLSSYDTIVERAVHTARDEHQWLASAHVGTRTAEVLKVAAESFGVSDASAAGQELLTHIIEILGRIVGPEMAVHLVEHTGSPVQRSQSATNAEIARDA